MTGGQSLDLMTVRFEVSQFYCKRFGGDRAGFELTIGADADLAVKRPGW